MSTDTTVSWSQGTDAAAYRVWWRRTDANNWQTMREAGGRACPVVIDETRTHSPNVNLGVDCSLTLPHIRVDDWVFGVSAVSKDGFESPVASAVPGGGFHPYIAPEKK